MELQYTIVSESSIEKLLKEVRSKIKDGWDPQGGVSVANIAGYLSYIYVQAMVKKSV